MKTLANTPFKMWDERGFIALFSVLTLSGILFILSAAADVAAYLAHSAATEEQFYRQAEENAFICARFATSRLEVDPDRFTNSATTSVDLPEGLGSCEIGSVRPQGNDVLLIVRGLNNSSVVPMQFAATRASSTAPLLLTAWTEY